ncbi:MAG: glycoside hydrolase family 3 C-terminal domain-containing protein [Bacteroidales bacterium]|nr:glycoside hydrolase family 3 C-terminal domain-containing protein [Bacteroidales bacterium]
MRKLLLILAAAAASACIASAAEITSEHKERAAKLVSQMTLEEKIELISGKVDGFSTYAIPRLGIPSIRMADGPQGVRNIGRKNIQSTFYPCGISAAASFNRDAVRQMGAGIACAAKAHGVQIMLCPGVNIYRSALCGRNFEYYGEDPYLCSETAANFIEGMQEEGVMATIKHFALNQQEFDRHGVSSNADERTMNEIYFPSFRKAVQKSKVGAVMTSYNLVNGTHAAENPSLVKDNLRKWGFEGIVMTDWVSTYSTLNFMNSGVDFEMPHNIVSNPAAVKALLENGAVSESDLDEKCIHILQTYAAFGFLDGNLEADPSAEDPALSQKRAYELALEGPVLLKNDDGILPLKGGKKNLIAVLGPNSNAIVCGGGSGWVNPEDGKGVTIAEGLKALGRNWNIELLGSPKPEVLKKASAVVLCLGFDKDTETENSDRSYGLDKRQKALIESVAAYTDRIVVVLNSGGEVDIMPWKDKVKAIIMDWYPGQEGGNALASILSGKVSPSGRLPFTFWGSLKANPAQKWYDEAPQIHKDKVRQHYHYVTYGEGVFLGYRGVEHFGVEPLYPFGYGLTYTSFEYSDLSVVPAGDGFDVSFSIRNSGKADAKEAAQVYVAPKEASVLRPAKELKGYQKKLVAKGATERYTIHLDADAFCYYDIVSHSWKADPGEYEIQVGASAGDIKLKASVQLK